MSTGPCEFDRDGIVVRLDMDFPATPAAITPVVDTVLAVVRDQGCAKGKEFEVETAVREALANAIRHGCGSDPTKQVRCCVACDELHGMLIIVRDPGPGFDVRNLPDPTMAENLYSEHGRGIFLINQLMDEVKIERGGTEIRMRMR
ncbi:MAG: ATP-binding protein [Terriglobales bacterium]